VAPSAKSVVCPHCNKRLVIEDFRTASYHAVRLLATCGDVTVDKRGHIVAAVHATNVLVEGKLTGNVTANGCVTLGQGAAVKGDIEASRLRIESGAVLSGFVRIGRPHAATEGER
jgi:cytoskeletal protein CcmA (bactofilin family)